MASAAVNGTAPAPAPAPAQAEGSGEMYDHSRVQQFIGANSLAAATPSRVTDFVKAQGGHTVITKVRLCSWSRAGRS